MSWWTGKTKLAVACVGDSNAVGSGGFTPPGGQTYNTNVRCYASANGEAPYSESNLGWRTLNPSGTARLAEYNSYVATGNVGFIGQLLGGNGNSAMQAASTLQAGSDAETVYLYQAGAGGTTAKFWATGDGWSTLERTVTAALASIPGSPTAFDCILFSLGANDAIQNYLPHEFYIYMAALRKNMVAKGWWVPGVTQIVFLDTPRTGYFGETYTLWNGMQIVKNTFCDRIAITNSTGFDLDDDLDVHYQPPSYTANGEQAGALFLTDIPKNCTVAATARRVGLNAKRLLLS